MALAVVALSSWFALAPSAEADVRVTRYSAVGQYGPFVSVATSDYESPYRMSKGVPLVSYADGERRNPVTTAQYGLIEWTRWVRFKRPKSLRIVLRQADWLVRSQDASGAWTFGFSYYAPGTSLLLSKGWRSGLAQGQAMSLLVRAYAQTDKPRYLRAARRALRPMRTPVVRGGVRRQLNGQGTWFEEYPTARPSYVLNGNLFAILGLTDLATVEPAARGLARRAARTASGALPLFDDGAGSTYYDLTDRYGFGKHSVAPVYPPLIEDTLRSLYSVTGARAFRTWAHRWRAPVSDASAS